MSKLLALMVAATLSFGVAAADKEKVCIDVKDAKTGKVKQECKMMKKHKKLEGTEVPKK
jgi:nitrate reductase cytochrome c-type subunit